MMFVQLKAVSKSDFEHLYVQHTEKCKRVLEQE